MIGTLLEKRAWPPEATARRYDLSAELQLSTPRREHMKNIRYRGWHGAASKCAAIVGIAAGLVLAPATAQKTQLLVYTALETDQIKAYEEGFTKANPNIEIKWVRDSSGIITAKILAEKANPQADVVMGLAATSL